MKSPFRSLVSALALGAICCSVPTFTACSTAPSARVAQVQTLKGVGQSAEATVALSAQLYKDGKITAAQARAILDFYDTKFQPAFGVAVDASQGNYQTIASPDLMMLAQELSALLTSYQKP